MTDKKIKRTLLPAITGLFVAYFLYYYYHEIMDVIYYPEDGDQVFSANAFYFPIFLVSVVPLLLVTGLFQFFIAIPVWENYRKGRKVFKLSLWQLIFLASIIFSVSVCFIMRHPYMTTKGLAINILSATIITLAYWTFNCLTLKYIDRAKNS